MTSNISRRYLAAVDMRTIDRILLKAGFSGTESVTDQDSRGDAARFLLKASQASGSTEDSLTAAITRYKQAIIAEPAPESPPVKPAKARKAATKKAPPEDI